MPVKMWKSPNNGASQSWKIIDLVSPVEWLNSSLILWQKSPIVWTLFRIDIQKWSRSHCHCHIVRGAWFLILLCSGGAAMSTACAWCWSAPLPALRLWLYLLKAKVFGCEARQKGSVTLARASYDSIARSHKKHDVLLFIINQTDVINNDGSK